jgi:hypothetical protein
VDVNDESWRVADEEQEDDHEEDDGLLGLVGLPLRRREGLDRATSASSVDGRLVLQLLGRTINKLATALDDPVDPVVEEAQTDEGDDALNE